MTQPSGAYRVALLLLFSLSVAAQKRLPLPAIRFQGAPQYTQQELLAAAGLKPEAHLNSSEVKAHAKLLNDTGLFEVIKYSSTNKGLVFTLTPSSQLFALHLDNVPLTPGKELDAQLHERFPLYHGLLPASGSMLEGVRQMLEEMLAANGIKASVKAAPTSGLGPQKLTAMNFTVVSPAVHIGPIRLIGVSPAMQAKASILASGQTGNNFDTEYTAPGLKHTFEDLYQDQGYAAVQIEVTQTDPPIVSDRSIDIPYTATIKEGGIYKLGSIDYPAGALVARAEIEKIQSKFPAGSGRPLDLFLVAARDAYHAHGYLDCAIVLHPAFDETTHIVNYGVEIAPGLPYRLAAVRFDGAPEGMAAKLKLAWKIAPGEIFDESYLPTFAALAEKKDKAMTKWMQTVVATYDVEADPGTHQVNCIFHFTKPAQNPH